ncbi:MAG: hypothetical protein M1823_002254 [Watsoniomyces obsoletus]|nr:MAG: hypothetical protein M1823_002254 [Watsoniomyces obsoletus]
MSTSGTVTALLSATVAQTSQPGTEPEEARERRHHLKDGKGFTNPWDSWRDMEAFEIGKAMIRRRITGQSNQPDTTPPTVPIRKPVFLQERHASKQLRATWLGHACYLVEFPSGFRVLFDPVFTERCSPFSWLGPKRYTPMPCKIEDIPHIDAVVISHNHYDHLSHPTIMKIKKTHPNVHFFVPLKNRQWFLDCGIDSVTELDWWEERDISLSPATGTSSAAATTQEKPPQVDVDVSTTANQTQQTPSDILARIGCLPCQHTSARGPFDKGHTLWASWSVESGGKKVWFGGTPKLMERISDTGYRAVPELPKEVDDYGEGHDYPHCPAFKQIGDLRGPFDLGLIPIGAYDPRWIMSPMHANPFDSVNIFIDTKCRKALGMHWGTVSL